MKKKFTILALSTVAVLVTACTEPGEMTGVGAATGGVVGAGLGAIIGNQTGDPGSGLAIGALAGAGAGAAMGNVLEAQDQAIRQQDEAIERQEQVIRANRGEIEELRRSSGDSVSYRRNVRNTYPDSSTRYGSNSTPQNLKIGSLPSHPPKPAINHSDLYDRDMRASFSSNQPAVAKQVVSAKRIDSIPVKSQKKEALPAMPPEDLVGENAVDGIEDQPVKEPVVATVQRRETFKEKELAVDGDKATETQITETQVTETVARVAPKQERSADCLSAEEEFKQASTKNEAPDKLFHVRRALRLCPDDSRFHASLGDIYASLNRSTDAQYEYQEALKLSPNDPSIKAKISSIAGNASEPY